MLSNWLQIYYKTLLKPTDFLKKTTSPPALDALQAMLINNEY